jgi:hypothetical protein
MIWLSLGWPEASRGALDRSTNFVSFPWLSSSMRSGI